MPQSPEDILKDLQGRVTSLEQANTTLTQQVQFVQSQLADTRNQLAVKLFTTNPATVNLQGG